MRLLQYMLAAAVAAALAAPALPAQFTTVVQPPEKAKPAAASPQQVAAGDSVRADTSAAARLQEMSAWVDSAAVAMGVDTRDSQPPAPPAVAPIDTTGGPVADSAGMAPRRDEPVFRDGAPAPDTATPLPMLALIGTALVGAGVLLRRRR